MAKEEGDTMRLIKGQKRGVNYGRVRKMITKLYKLTEAAAEAAEAAAEAAWVAAGAVKLAEQAIAEEESLEARGKRKE